MKKLFILALVALGMVACESKKDPNVRFIPDSNGNINALTVVIENDLWSGPVGDEIRRVFAAAVDGLPQQEPLFSINQMPPVAFSDFARNSRNVLLVTQENKSAYDIKEDVYARPQRVAFIKGSNQQEIIDSISKNAKKIVATFKSNELKEKQRRIAKSLNRDKKLEEVLGISLRIPSIYEIVKQEKNFFWIEKEIQKGTMNIIAYEMPLNSIPKDSTTVDAIIKMRDSIGESYIPGRLEGAHMITEKAYAPYLYDAIIDNKPAFETRGMWEVKNDFMAGPFLNYAVEDKINNRLLVVEGFVFAPSISKRDYIFELEAILRSLEIKE